MLEDDALISKVSLSLVFFRTFHFRRPAREAAALSVSAPAASLVRACNRFSLYACLFAHHSALNTGSSPTCNHHLDVSFIRSLCQVMDQVPPWQRITEGYESPTEEVSSSWPATGAH